MTSNPGLCFPPRVERDLRSAECCPRGPSPRLERDLEADSGSSCVTTPGGYRIEATGKFAWCITGPDGKTTKVHGDPHVAEGDGGKWDFKKDSTFVLGDGTRVNVNTVPWKDGKQTVTAELEIVSTSGKRAVIDGIDQGVGKVRTVDYGPEQIRTQQRFEMGKETDDWSIGGREILGSKAADDFKLGNFLHPRYVERPPRHVHRPPQPMPLPPWNPRFPQPPRVELPTPPIPPGPVEPYVWHQPPMPPAIPWVPPTGLPPVMPWPPPLPPQVAMVMLMDQLMGLLRQLLARPVYY
jgi:hypothetical protein